MEVFRKDALNDNCIVTVKDALLKTTLDSVNKEIIKHHGCEYSERIEEVYIKLNNSRVEDNKDNMVLYIRALKQTDEEDEDFVVNEFDCEDTELMFDVC